MTRPTRTLSKLTAALLLPLLLPACGALSALGDATEPLEVVVLTTPADLPQARRMLPREIIIEEPTTGGALATDRIMVQPGPRQAQYLPGIRWPDPAPVTLQTLMLRSLDATGAFQYVGRRPLGPGGDFAIVTEIVDFQAVLDPETEAAAVEMRLIVRIVRERGVQIVASRSFATQEPAASLEEADIAAAFDTAAGRVVSEFTVWTLNALGAG